MTELHTVRRDNADRRRHLSRVDAVSVGLVAGFVADRLLGDPARFHPVAGFGRVAGTLHQRWYRDDRKRGVLNEFVLVGGATALGAGLQTIVRRCPPVQALVVTAGTWAVLGGRSLEREALAVHGLVMADDLAGARRRVRSLVGRDPSQLDADELGRACVESVAENTSDAVTAPLFWGAVAGLPGLLAYRAINTLDAMVGHRTPRWERFGWAAARVDDAANWLPARLAAVLTALLSRRPRQVLAAIRRDARQHPSPNGGVIETAFAATLGVHVGGANTYFGRAEDRGTLGDGRPVRITDVPPAVRLGRRLAWVSLAVVVAARCPGRRLTARRAPHA